ncbi:hypothetical protein PILCRDRAFT_15660 [Piloderma croceum F 1598]|uniref:Uncharacterized protein n=1 Tax=Piloderma croceum (strain F 1598) TaxID=765440 RepID=A0A0C3EK11_PILCF|nr:hypothetical protein PILCRDRAFT_15660 [Piloderma croceum F 1598]
MEKRGEHLNIYQVRLDKLPTLAEVHLKLSETEVRHGNLSGSVSTLTEGLAIQKSQMLLQRHVTSLGSTCSVAQKNELLDRRRKLEARITTYENRISIIMKLDDDTQWSLSDIDPRVAESSDDLPEVDSDEWLIPEKERITLPSALAAGEIEWLSLESIAMVEAELRKGQVADTLEGLCLSLGEKSLCFRTQVHNANSQRTTHRAWDNVHKLDAEARKCQAMYRQARGALQRLSIDPEYVATLHDITDDDLKVAGDLTDECRFGQRSDALPWFWQFGDAVDSGGLRMQECTYSYWPCAVRLILL